MKTKIKASLNNMHLSDIYTLMLFILYKTQDIPEYATTSELCFLLDGSNLTRLMTYFAGKTVKFPTEKEFVVLTNALLLYQYVNIDGNSLAVAQSKLQVTPAQREEVMNLYLKIIPIISQYNIDRGQIQKNDK